MILNGKTILFLCQKLYDYDELIKNSLTNLGANVLLFENRFFRQDPVLNNDIFSMGKRFMNPNYKDQYIDSIFKEIDSTNIDYLFVIGGFSVTDNLVKELKSKSPSIKVILYLWDSISVWDYRHLLKDFDKVFSFDRDDCLKYELNYLPLFYTTGPIKKIPIENRENKILYVASVGVQTQNRLKIVEEVVNLCKEKSLSYIIYLFYKKGSKSFLYRFLRILKLFTDVSYKNFLKAINNSILGNYLHAVPLSTELYKEKLANSQCVIDIPIDGQVGLTMRTIESLAYGCKFITSNKSIREEDFFDEDWIKVVDVNEFTKALTDTNFLNSIPKNELSMEKYKLENWLLTMLDE